MVYDQIVESFKVPHSGLNTEEFTSRMSRSPSVFLKACLSLGDLILDLLLQLAAGEPSGPCTGHQLPKTPSQTTALRYRFKELLKEGCCFLATTNFKYPQ